MNILLIRNLEVPVAIMKEMASKKYRIIHIEDGGVSEIKLIKPEKFTFGELRSYLSKGFSHNLVGEVFKLEDLAHEYNPN